MAIIRPSSLFISTLFFFISLTQLAAQNVNKTSRSEFVTYDKWHCGAGEFDKSLSHQLASGDCPKRMYEADLCCVVHDICYMEKHSQAECDEEFCHCLERTVAQAARAINQTSAAGCQTVSNSFCEIVKLFGGMAYATARKAADKQKAAMQAWEASEAARKANNGTTTITKGTQQGTSPTTTTVSSSSSSSSSTSSPFPSPSPSSSSSSTSPSLLSSSSSITSSSTATPAQIGHFVTHKFPLDCFDATLSKCTKQLQQCTSRHFNSVSNAAAEGADALVFGANLADCSAQFCQCASSSPQSDQPIGQTSSAARRAMWRAAMQQPKDECAQSLATICAQMADIPGGAGNVNFWSVNVNYIGQPISIGLAMVGSLIFLFTAVSVVFALLKLVAFVKGRLHQDESIRKNYAKSSIRRNTLTALRSVGGGGGGQNDDDDDAERGRPHYMSFGHQKESTASSPADSEPSAQKLLGNGGPSNGVLHHHKKAHSDLAGHNKNLLHNPQHNMPLNSSQIHLIAGTGNSSSTLSDISS